MRPEPPISDRAPLAGFGRRAVALLLDTAILFVAYVLIGVLLISLGAPESVSVGAAYLIGLVYYPLGWSGRSEGQTFGMRGLDIEIVGRDGEFISLWRAFGRFLAASVSAVPLGLGFWWAIWDKQNQTWHDKIAGTWVRRVDYSPRADGPGTAPQSPLVVRQACPRCGESIAVTARACRFCGVELGEHWAS